MDDYQGPDVLLAQKVDGDEEEAQQGDWYHGVESLIEVGVTEQQGWGNGAEDVPRLALAKEVR